MDKPCTLTFPQQLQLSLAQISKIAGGKIFDQFQISIELGSRIETLLTDMPRISSQRADVLTFKNDVLSPMSFSMKYEKLVNETQF
jgi:hypothetical protein